jgi:hypothetical protein
MTPSHPGHRHFTGINRRELVQVGFSGLLGLGLRRTDTLGDGLGHLGVHLVLLVKIVESPLLQNTTARSLFAGSPRMSWKSTAKR